MDLFIAKKQLDPWKLFMYYFIIPMKLWLDMESIGTSRIDWIQKWLIGLKSLHLIILATISSWNRELQIQNSKCQFKCSFRKTFIRWNEMKFTWFLNNYIYRLNEDIFPNDCANWNVNTKHKRFVSFSLTIGMTAVTVTTEIFFSRDLIVIICGISNDERLL